MSKFSAILDGLIAESPPELKGAFEGQVLMKTGVNFMGPIRKHPKQEGIYIITGVGRRDEKEQVPSLQVDTYFDANEVVAVNHLKAIEKSSGLIIPGGGGKVIGLPGGRP